MVSKLMEKNRLQEFYQKIGMDLPLYNTIKVVGDDPQKQISWLSTVIIIDPKTKKRREFIGDSAKSKILTDRSAANNALKWLETLDISKDPPEDASSNRADKINKKLKKETVVLLDVENMPKIILELLETDVPDNLWIYAFVGKHHHQLNTFIDLAKIHQNLIVVPSASTRKDGTDTCIQLYTGMFLYDEAFDEYIICTRDHFGGTLVEFISDANHPWKSKQARLATSINHIVDAMNDIGYN